MTLDEDAEMTMNMTKNAVERVVQGTHLIFLLPTKGE